MIAAIIFVISITAFGYFGICYWRATVQVASRALISDRLRVAAGISRPSLSPCDFRAILKIRDLTPNLEGNDTNFCALRTYYLIMQTIGHLFPSLTRWADAEMTMCSRYVAVRVGHHLERNIACAVRMRAM